MSEKRWIRKVRIWRPMSDLKVMNLSVFYWLFWNHPSFSGRRGGGRWQEFASSHRASPALCCDWCCQLTGSPAGRSVSQAFGCLDLIGRALGKVRGELTSVTSVINFARVIRVKIKPLWRPLSVAHAVRAHIWGNSGKRYVPFPHWIRLLPW